MVAYNLRRSIHTRRGEMRFFRLMTITVLLLAFVVLGSACSGAKGEEGPQGPKGDTGATGVGVQNIVNNGNGTFTVNLTNGTAYTTDNLTGPRGEQGEQGAQGIQGPTGAPGIGVEWVGEWDSATLYGKYDAVGYQGSSYISKQPNNTNNLPTDTNWWDLWVAKGDTGATGNKGDTGVGLNPSYATVAAWEWMSDNATWSDLDTVGPSVTVTIGSSGKALVTLTAGMQHSDSCYGYMGFAVSGATNLEPDGKQNIGGGNDTGLTILQLGATFMVTGLNPGSNTFTAKYIAFALRPDMGEVSFTDRCIIVQPL
jgi:hypothetical protein